MNFGDLTDNLNRRFKDILFWHFTSQQNLKSCKYVTCNIYPSQLIIKQSGVTVITLKFGKAAHAKDYIFATDEEQRKAWGE